MFHNSTEENLLKKKGKNKLWRVGFIPDWWWCVFVFVGLAAVLMIVAAVVRWRRTKGVNTECRFYQQCFFDKLTFSLWRLSFVFAANEKGMDDNFVSLKNWILDNIVVGNWTVLNSVINVCWRTYQDVRGGESPLHKHQGGHCFGKE